MIIFFNKKTGEIVGTIDGRKHTKEHLNMWIGDKKKTGRLIIEWVKSGVRTVFDEVKEFQRVGVTQEGDPLFKAVVKKIKREIPILKPNHKQEKLIKSFESNHTLIYNYKIDPKTKQFIKKDK